MKRYFVLLMLILFVLSGCNRQANFSERCKREAEQQKYKNDIRENLRKKIVNSIEMKRYKENGVAFNYIYLYRNTREKALEYMFTKADYK